MFYMVIHVPIDESTNRVHMDSTAIQTMIIDVVSEATMLQPSAHHHVPTAVKPWQTDQQQGYP